MMEKPAPADPRADQSSDKKGSSTDARGRRSGANLSMHAGGGEAEPRAVTVGGHRLTYAGSGEDVGHMPQLEAPGRFIAALERFLDETDPAQLEARQWGSRFPTAVAS